MERVLVERRDGVATVTINRPECRNALDAALRDEAAAQARLGLTADHAAAVAAFLAKQKPVFSGR